MSSLRMANLGNLTCEIPTTSLYFCIMIFSRFTASALATLFIFILSYGCTKVIEVELPDSEPFLVVEGSIRNGEMPLVLLSKSSGYFDPISVSLEGIYLAGATVTVSVDGVPYILDEICTDDLTTSALEDVANALGLDSDILLDSPICAYTSFDELELVGNFGSVYDLNVIYESIEVSSSSKLQNLVPIDTAYFQIPSTATNDSLGLIATSYTDPDTLGNSYRWSSRRVSKDPSFIYPLGSAWDDSFGNGVPFEFSAFRYSDDFNSEPDGEAGFWKSGDTVIVRFESIDKAAYSAIMTFEASVSAQGNPFAPPTNVESNIDGGLGWWIAYSASVDTVFCY